MVLQDKYSRAASRKYKRTHAPTPEEAAEHAAIDAAIKQVEQRRLGTNADRYKDDDEQRAKAEGRSTTIGPDGQPVPSMNEEVDEEEELRKAEEQAELELFLERQRERLASPSGAADFRAPGEDDEDDEDVDHSFAHLRIGGSSKAGRARPPPPARPPVTAEEKEEMHRMQDDARHRQAVRDLKDRFAGVAPRPSSSVAKPPPPRTVAEPKSRNVAASSPISLPSKMGVQPAAKGQDFLDMLL